MNHEDPNYSVSIPVFTIHGNHDDLAGVSGSVVVGGWVASVHVCLLALFPGSSSSERKR